MAKRKPKNKDVLEDMLNDQRVRSELARRVHLLFFSFYFSDSIKYEIAPFQEQLFALTEDERIKLAVIVAFRGSAKSTIVTTSYAIWSILGVQQKKFVVIASQTEAKARQHLQNIKRELENNTLLQQDLGPFQEERDQWGATSLYLPKFNAKIMISSVGQSIRGMRHGAHRPDLIILDDVEDTESVKTQEGRDKVWDWLTKDVIPAGDLNTRIIAVGNLLHEDSLLKRLERKIKNNDIDGVYLEFPIVDEEGNPLWVGKFPNKEAVEQERRKIMNNVAWSVEYLLKIVSENDQIIKQEWIHFYDTLPDGSFTSFTGTDLAISQEDSADYTSMVTINVYENKKDVSIYVLPFVVNKKMTSMETIEKAEEVSTMFKSKILIEDVGYQRSIAEHIESDGYSVEAVKLNGRNKAERLMIASYFFQGAKIFFPRIGAELLIRQILGFGTEKHDDMVDALTLAINYTFSPRTQESGFLQIAREDLEKMKDTPEFKARLAIDPVLQTWAQDRGLL